MKAQKKSEKLKNADILALNQKIAEKAISFDDFKKHTNFYSYKRANNKVYCTCCGNTVNYIGRCPVCNAGQIRIDRRAINFQKSDVFYEIEKIQDKDIQLIRQYYTYFERTPKNMIFVSREVARIFMFKKGKKLVARTIRLQKYNPGYYNDSYYRLDGRIQDIQIVYPGIDIISNFDWQMVMWNHKKREKMFAIDPLKYLKINYSSNQEWWKYISFILLLRACLNDFELVEFMFKTKMFSWLELFRYEYDIEKVKKWKWQLIQNLKNKKVLRKMKNIKSLCHYFDALYLAENLNMNLKKPSVFAFESAIENHDKWEEKLRKKREENQLKDACKYESEYQAKIKKYKDIQLGENEYKIRVIPTVTEVYNQAKQLHHCAFTNEYYKKENSLLLECKKDDTVFETAEVNISKEDVGDRLLQCRGLCNYPSMYHDTFVKLIKKNINQLLRGAYGN